LSTFDQFAAPLKNNFKAVKPSNFNKFVFNYSFRLFNNKEAMYLNTEEILLLFGISP